MTVSQASLSSDEIEHRFGNHQATIEGPEATLPKHAGLRSDFKEFAGFLNELLPDGREKSLAFTALEAASMWSHKAIASTAPLSYEADPEPVIEPEEEPFLGY